MVQYTNNAKVTINPSRTEVFMSFSQDTLNENNTKDSTPIDDLVMTGELAKKLMVMLATLLSEPQQIQPTPPEQKSN